MVADIWTNDKTSDNGMITELLTVEPLIILATPVMISEPVTNKQPADKGNWISEQLILTGKTQRRICS